MCNASREHVEIDKMFMLLIYKRFCLYLFPHVQLSYGMVISLIRSNCELDCGYIQLNISYDTIFYVGSVINVAIGIIITFVVKQTAIYVLEFQALKMLCTHS